MSYKLLLFKGVLKEKNGTCFITAKCFAIMT